MTVIVKISAVQEQNLVLEIVNSHRDDEVIVRERAKLLLGEIVVLFVILGARRRSRHVRPA